MEKLQRMPMTLAVFIMVVCVAVGVGAGNQKALNNAIRKYCPSTGEIEQFVGDRRVYASNLLVIAERRDKDSPETLALKAAIQAAESARGMGNIAKADENLGVAVSASVEAIVAGQTATEKEKELAIGVRDDMASRGRMLRRVSNEYNTGVEEVMDVYERLPMGFLLSRPPERFL